MEHKQRYLFIEKHFSKNHSNNLMKINRVSKKYKNQVNRKKNQLKR